MNKRHKLILGGVIFVLVYHFLRPLYFLVSGEKFAGFFDFSSGLFLIVSGIFFVIGVLFADYRLGRTPAGKGFYIPFILFSVILIGLFTLVSSFISKVVYG